MEAVTAVKGLALGEGCSNNELYLHDDMDPSIAEDFERACKRQRVAGTEKSKLM